MITSPGAEDAAPVWAALGGDPALPAAMEQSTVGPVLAARLPVQRLARATVAVCALAAAELSAARAADRTSVPRVRVEDGAVATAFLSERRLRIDGRALTNFAPLSRFWRTADGWVRTHANYPHHRARLLAALGLHGGGSGAGDRRSEEALVDRVAAELAGRRAADVEEAVYAAGGLAVAVRTPEEWARHPQGALVAARPLLARERIDSAAPRPRTPASPAAPAAGLRVLDLTRVTAGPVATRTLALLGADVLRIDAPELPESADAHADTGFGKRSTVLHLGRRTDRAVFEELLSAADLVVTGYRPGALDRFGLTPEALGERRPGLVIGQLSAWGEGGPWHRRRGFDSVVQAACGIAMIEADPADPDGRPGVLPAQALDHGTGYLLAAAALRAVTDQYAEGGTRTVRLALAQTAAWLTGGTLAGPTPYASARPPAEGRAEDQERYLDELDGPLGRMRYALSPVDFDGGPTRWARPPGPWGTDPARWEAGPAHRGSARGQACATPVREGAEPDRGARGELPVPRAAGTLPSPGTDRR
ncbi:CoA transferase [Streptomyces palmae]|uniref:CoA transferase n=1 Tax=Streptomyces palmae TaxID=1701085 RepID=A0A4Z0HA75_9ACTN|nr:CoA transferase [Streptomyces palmae]TGB09577.1 hypothetical protein E4099_13570 [Streptomyces palmae]